MNREGGGEDGGVVGSGGGIETAINSWLGGWASTVLLESRSIV